MLEVFRSSRDTQIEITPVDEGVRNDLAHHLHLDTPAAQLRDWFGLGAEPMVADDEEEPDDDIYTLLDRRTIDSEGSSAEWKFIEARRDPRGPRYRFRCNIPAIPARTGRAYLARNHNGTLAQIRRRHKAIDDLRSHEGLLRLLMDPQAVSRSSNDELPTATSDIPLDNSKLEALAKLWSLQPSFAIQGPPGTGKTTLIKGFSDRLFSSDPTAQVLLTAHSHHTVDDVRSKLSDLFSSSDSPIIVRIGSPKPTEHDIDPVTNNLLGRLYSSALSLEAPPYLRERLGRVAASGHRSGEGDDEFRSMLLLVQDAANMTFSTSNAGELAELAARGRRFDWSIIEEAGKAHGFDMAIAFQESHRLLLIGDHRQLSPFNASVFKKLLLEPLRVKLAIQAGAKFAPGYVDPSLVEDEDDELETETLTERCARWRQMVTLFEVIFESSLGSTPGSLSPAATLTDQHRMHPDIADLVGMIFYPDDAGGTILRSPLETHDKFKNAAPFNIKGDSWLPEQRIVWCDVAWQQKEEFSEGEIDGLFAAPNEAEIVVNVLEQLAPADDSSCHIQILSPYRDQLAEIRAQIDAARHCGRLDHMFEPPFDLRTGKRLGATVDEFQGSEADVIIASLVRNNALVPWKSVGFLKEPNRMNVLLSRAKYKLIIVGSWDFFASRCNEHTPPDAEYAYIGRMMEQMSRAQALGRLARMRVA